MLCHFLGEYFHHVKKKALHCTSNCQSILTAGNTVKPSPTVGRMVQEETSIKLSADRNSHLASNHMPKPASMLQRQHTASVYAMKDSALFPKSVQVPSQGKTNFSSRLLTIFLECFTRMETENMISTEVRCFAEKFQFILQGGVENNKDKYDNKERNATEQYNELSHF